MILGHHLILAAYGFWLPNDPRGSCSDFVGKWELVLAAGKATKVYTRRSLAHRPHDNRARRSAKDALAYPAVEWSGRQAREMTRGFNEVADHWDFRIHACSMLPTHVHLVIGRIDRDIGLIMNQLKGRASNALAAANMHPFQNVFTRDGIRQTCWAGRGWRVFLHFPDDMRRAIRYVEDNPPKEGKPAQHWSFVQPFIA